MNGSLVPFGIPLPSLGTGFRSFHYSRITSHWRRSGSYVPEGGAGCSSGWPERPGCGSARGELPPPSTRSLVGRCAIPRPSVAGVLSQACGPISSTPLSPIGRNKKTIRFAGHQTSQDRSAATAESLVRGRFDDIGSLGFLTGPPGTMNWLGRLYIKACSIPWEGASSSSVQLEHQCSVSTVSDL